MTKHLADADRIPALAELRAGLLGAARREADVPATHRMRNFAAGSVGIALLVTAVIVVIGSSDTKAPQAARNGAAATADELLGVEQPAAPQPTASAILSSPMYTTLNGLTADSQLVVEGTVKEVGLGREIVDIDPQYPTRFLNTVLTVDEVLKGSARAPEVTVETMELGFSSVPGQADTEWRKPGEHVLAFLIARSPGETLFNPTTYAQSFYRVKDGQLQALSPQPGGLGERIQAMSLSELRQAVPAGGQ